MATALPSTGDDRVSAISIVVPIEEDIKAALTIAANAAGGTVKLTAAIDSSIDELLKAGKISNGLAQRLTFANAVASVSHNNLGLMKALDANQNVNSIRDFALSHSAQDIEPLLDDLSKQEPAADKKELAAHISRSLFTTNPTAVVQRVTSQDDVLVMDPVVRRYVIQFFQNQPDFDIANSSINVAIAAPNAFNSIPNQYRQPVIEALKVIQRVQAISPIPEMMPALAKANLTTALAVSQVPKAKFVAATRELVSSKIAEETHATATSATIRNDQMLITLFQAVKGTGLQVLDTQTPGGRVFSIQEQARAQGIGINLETLFGTMDMCVSDDCTTVYSAASYFVEILNFLRNNNLKSLSEKGSIEGTILGKLFRRRPDLGQLQLTCENTNIVLPYADLANEVMESFILSLDAYTAAPLPKQASIDVFNAGTDKTSEELLAQPQNTNFDAYRILADAIYPVSSLPYHQPIDSIRTFLGYTGVQRYELLDSFRPQRIPDQTLEQQQMQVDILDRAVQSEFLGFTQQEYIILTKEAFWSKNYFDKTEGYTHTIDEYRDKIGVKPVYAHYGYKNEADMLDTTDNQPRKGLQWVKAQFLPRTNIEYTTLVEVVQTKFVNPMFPEGRNKRMMDSLRFSYKFLATLVSPGPAGNRRRFAKLIAFLKVGDLMGELSDALTNQDSTASYSQSTYGKSNGSKGCTCDDDIEEWICDNFENLGHLIVLDMGEGPRLPIEGEIVAIPHQGVTVNDAVIWPKKLPSGAVAVLQKDGRVLDASGSHFGEVDINCRLLVGSAIDGVTIAKAYKDYDFYIKRSPTQPDLIGMIDDQGFIGTGTGSLDSGGKLLVAFEYPLLNHIKWILDPLNGGGCNIENTQLKHLNGDSLTVNEWDRLQRFLRLWRKLGWSVADTDTALIGVAQTPTDAEITISAAGKYSALSNGIAVNGTTKTTTATSNTKPIDLNSFATSTSITNGYSGKATKAALADITPFALEKLGSIVKLLPLTQLPLQQLLTFWAPIPTTGGVIPLFAQLFFHDNLLPTDNAQAAFTPDADGNYFVGAPTSISDNLPVLMAALRMTAEDIMILEPDTSIALNIDIISDLYRHALLAGVLGISVSDLKRVLDVSKQALGDPFTDPDVALTLVQTWQDMQSSTFTFQQLDFVFTGHDDVTSPVGPTQNDNLSITKTLYDGLKAITAANPDIDDSDATAFANSDKVKAETQLLYSPDVVTQVVGLLEGTNVFFTGVPPILPVTIKDLLSKKLKYDADNGILYSTGILTSSETDDAKALIDGDPGTVEVVLTKAQAAKKSAETTQWTAAIDNLRKKAVDSFHAALGNIFTSDAEAVILAGDIPEPKPSSDTQSTTNPDGKPPSEKRKAFLREFIPFLRGKLDQIFVLDTMASVAGITGRELTRVLLEEVLTFSGQSALDLLISIQDQPVVTNTAWTGYLAPPTTDTYTIFATSIDTPPSLSIAGQSYPFPNSFDDPPHTWSTQPIQLDSGKLYKLDATGLDITKLSWRSTRSANMPIPASALLPDHSTAKVTQAITELYKQAIIVNGFKLTALEVQYFNTHIADFGGPKDSPDAKFIVTDFKMWERFKDYANLRNSLPQTAPSSLIDLFTWCTINIKISKDSMGDKLRTLISNVTGWNVDDVKVMLLKVNFANEVPTDFVNETNLVKLQKLLKVAAKIGVDIPRIFDWAAPRTISETWDYHAAAQDVQKALRSKFKPDAWRTLVRPLNDTLRENQKNAIMSYLLVQDAIIQEGVTDADGLFEFFLIDPQVTPLMETSRIKQAISTVQLYIQRCLLGLEVQEKDGGVQATDIPQDRWEWMQKYRLWEANRKVYLYPENYIDPSLRDYKTQFFQELESELLQKDISSTTAYDALKNYVYKLDEIANLNAVAIYKDTTKLYIFTRTHAAPYNYYWTFYDTTKYTWNPWQSISVDIPNYTTNSAKDKPIDSGAYVVPIVWQNRLLLFLPQLTKKAIPVTELGTISFNSIGMDTTKGTNSTKATEAWEIQMGWTEYRGGKWTPRQLSSGSVIDIPTDNTTSPPIESYVFLPLRSNLDTKVKVGVFSQDSKNALSLTSLGAFDFNGRRLIQTTLVKSITLPTTTPGTLTISWGNWITTVDGTKQLFSLQGVHSDTVPATATTPVQKDVISFTCFDAIPEIEYPVPKLTDVISYDVTVQYDSGRMDIPANLQPFYHRFAHSILSELMATDDVQSVYNYLTKIQDVDISDAFGVKGLDSRELSSPYAIYDWELGLHAPMLIVDRLLKTQKFDDALKVCHYMFNPLGSGVNSKPEDLWVFPPFKSEKTQTLEEYFFGLTPGQSNGLVSQWRDNPFQPFVIARGRPVAYMKWIVMKYIEILIAYGDYWFTQNTLETIPMAIQMYVMASHLYGPRGQKIPRQSPKKVETYMTLLDKWDAFGNAMVDLETAFPFSNQTILPLGVTTQGDVGMANLFGFASTLYFAIPDNPTLRALGTTIDDRLFKIRHSQDINGITRILPLFEPPIDPMLLVQATAKGLSLSTVLADLNGPMPNFRLMYLLQKAIELCGELKSLGGAFLAAKEKGDGEAYTMLRQKHEGIMQSALMEVKKLQLDDSNKSLDALTYSRNSPVYRLQHYLKLIGQDLSSVPQVNADFQELANQIDTPIDDSGLKLSPYEKEEADKLAISQNLLTAVGAMETLAAIFLTLPSTDIEGQPLGVGVTVVWGAPQLGQGTQAIAAGLKIGADQLQIQSGNAGTKAANQRQLQDRIFQANSAGYEISNIDKQILSAKIRIDIANREILNQQTQIDQAQEVADFLRNKYTSTELYSWMETTTRSLYYQTYTQAYDLAKKAERAYKFERPLEANTTFIQPGYWDSSRDGLLAGEQLYLGLKALESAYIDKRGYDYEITKNVSLRQLNPLELLRLRETGSCSFSIPEVLFDMDFPGHYMRRIRSVAITMPCIVGPYTSVNATLRILQHTYRTDPKAANAADYVFKDKDPNGDARFSTTNIPISAIAVSGAQNDSGVFELNFNGDRYIPFEGAGCISTWQLELPSSFSSFDYQTLSDVILHVKYTSIDGGDNLKAAASGAVASYASQVQSVLDETGLLTVVDIRNEFAVEWAKAVSLATPSTVAGASAPADTQVMKLLGLNQRLPFYASTKTVNASVAYLLSDVKMTSPTVTEMLKDAQGKIVNGKSFGLDFAEAIGSGTGGLQKFASAVLSGVGIGDWELSVASKDLVGMKRLWLCVKFTAK